MVFTGAFRVWSLLGGGIGVTRYAEWGNDLKGRRQGFDSSARAADYFRV